jgi:hypothetical protein
VGGIPSWTTFLREEEVFEKSKEAIEQLKNTPEKNKVKQKTT